MFKELISGSLAWLELATIMAKVVFSSYLELVNTELDWLRDSRMQSVWERPALMVRVRRRAE